MFSPIQKRVIDILGNKSMKMKELSEKVYEGSESSLSPGASVRTAIQYINYKCKLHKLKWRLESDGKMGRNGCTIRKVKCL